MVLILVILWITKLQFPDNSEKTYSNDKTVTEEYTVNKNGTYKFTAEGGNGRTASKSINVKNAMLAGDIQLTLQNAEPTNQSVVVKAVYDENFMKLDEVGSKTSIDKDDVDNDDPLYNDIVEFVISTRKASASLLQRRFKLGYNRAARIIDLLEERGIIGPANGSKPREVLVDNDEEDEE